MIARELRSKTFKYLRLKRDSSTEVTKDAALRVLIAAANGNGFVNDVAKNLKDKPFYDDGDIPTGQNLTHHLRKSSREAVTRMFREANEQLFEIADRHDYFPDEGEVAFDIKEDPETLLNRIAVFSTTDTVFALDVDFVGPVLDSTVVSRQQRTVPHLDRGTVTGREFRTLLLRRFEETSGSRTLTRRSLRPAGRAPGGECSGTVGCPIPRRCRRTSCPHRPGSRC